MTAGEADGVGADVTTGGAAAADAKEVAEAMRVMVSPVPAVLVDCTLGVTVGGEAATAV